MNSFCDQLIRLALHQPSKGRTMSARKEFNHLIRSMPLRWGPIEWALRGGAS
jgi:hypothetical protein